MIWVRVGQGPESGVQGESGNGFWGEVVDLRGGGVGGEVDG